MNSWCQYFVAFLLYNSVLAGNELLCLITTTERKHSQVLNSYDMWAHKCDDVLIVTDAPINTTLSYLILPGLNKREHVWKKMRKVYKYVMQNLKYRDYHWYAKVDDDAYFFTDQARMLVRKYDHQDEVLLGYRWGFFVTRGYTDGGTCILSNAAISTFNRLLDDKQCPEETERAEDDQEIQRCFERIGIYPQDTRDAEGRQRFFQYHPDETRNTLGISNIRTVSYYWLHDFPDYVSLETINVHHMSPYELHFFHYLTHDVKL